MKLIIATLTGLSTLLCMGTLEASPLPNLQYAGCSEDQFVTVEETTVNIEFQGSSYSPMCLRVKPGTVVTIAATAKHPLQASVDFNGVSNPFRAEGEHFLENQTRTMTEVGTFGYFCTRHGDAVDGGSMGGLIVVE